MQVGAEPAHDLLDEDPLLRVVDGTHGLQDLEPLPVAGCGVEQRLDVFGKAAAAVADAGVEKAVADARIGTDPFAHLLDVDAERVGEVGKLVHEADARGEHGVGGVLGELCRAHVHVQHPVALAVERRIQLAHDGA